MESVPQRKRAQPLPRRMTILHGGVTNSSPSAAGPREELMAQSLGTREMGSPTAGVPRTAEKQELAPKDEDSERLKPGPSTEPRAGKK